MRLFIAIDLPDSVKDYLRKLQAILPEAKMSNRPSHSEAKPASARREREASGSAGAELKKVVRPKGATFTHDFHLTLKFLGSCDERRAKKVEEELAHVSFQPFEARLEAIGTFGGKIPRVVWIGLKVPPQLEETAYEIEDRMEKLGFEKESRGAGFAEQMGARSEATTHAGSSSAQRDSPRAQERRFVPHITLARIKFVENSARFLEDLKKISVDQISFPVSDFHLFESRLSPEGALHVKLATFSGQGKAEFR